MPPLRLHKRCRLCLRGGTFFARWLKVAMVVLAMVATSAGHEWVHSWLESAYAAYEMANAQRIHGLATNATDGWDYGRW